MIAISGFDIVDGLKCNNDVYNGVFYCNSVSDCVLLISGGAYINCASVRGGKVSRTAPGSDAIFYCSSNSIDRFSIRDVEFETSGSFVKISSTIKSGASVLINGCHGKVGVEASPAIDNNAPQAACVAASNNIITGLMSAASGGSGVTRKYSNFWSNGSDE